MTWGPSNINGHNMEQSMQYLTNLYLVFVDFEKGFESVYWNKMWEVMNRYGIP
jgi:hypothetical protein